MLNRFGDGFFGQIYQAIKSGKLKWAIVPNFRDKSNKGLLTSLKKSLSIYNAANSNCEIQFVPLPLTIAASHVFYLYAELKCIEKIEEKLLADHCYKEISANLSKEYPFLCIGSCEQNFSSDPFFAEQILPVLGAFSRASVDRRSECFVPLTQLNIEQKLVRTMLPLWQKPMDPLEITICGRILKLSSFHYVDPRNTVIKIGPDRIASERNNLDFIEPEYKFKDKLLR